LVALRRFARFDALVVTALVWFLGKFLRYAFPPLFETIGVTYGVSRTVLGTAYTGLMLVYAAMQFPSGLLADRLGAVRVITAGVLISAAIFLVTLLLADLGSFYVSMGLVCLMGLLAIGVADDYLKLTSARRAPGSREGLYTWEKLVLQLGLAVVLGLFINHYGYAKFTMPIENWQQMSHALTLPFFKTWVNQNGEWQPNPNLIVLGTWSFVLVAVLFIAGTANAVNLTDGMDGLASGVMSIVAFAFMVLALIAGYTQEDGDFVLAKYLLVPHIPFSDELAVVAGAMVGACLGFLWFNGSPAQVFMGDSGSLPLGGLIGFIAVVIRQEFLLLIIGGVFFAELLSVVLQVAWFKLTGGRRLLKCAPIHHHFHLAGWTEQQVVVRFWLLTAICVALALATIKIR